jgi:hypothetical protein
MIAKSDRTGKMTETTIRPVVTTVGTFISDISGADADILAAVDDSEGVGEEF